MDDLGLNDYLRNTYGTTIESGQALFRLLWSTNVTEIRRGTFRDYYGEIIVREVTEVRECLRYPLAQDRWILEKLVPTPVTMYEIDLFTKYTYENIYTFQDAKGKYLPLTIEMLEAAMYLYLQAYVKMTPKERTDFRMERLAEREKAKKEKIRQIIGEGMRSHYFMPLIR